MILSEVVQNDEIEPVRHSASHTEETNPQGLSSLSRGELDSTYKMVIRECKKSTQSNNNHTESDRANRVSQQATQLYDRNQDGPTLLREIREHQTTLRRSW